MAFVVKDRVQETSTTTGTGTFTLAGATAGFSSFSVIGNANTTYYTITANADWEVGIGTYTSSGTTLSRDTVLASSNSNNLVDFPAGTKNVFVVYPAGRAVIVNGSTVEVPNSATLPVTAGGTGSSTATFSGANITSLNASSISTGTLANDRTTASSSNGASTIVARDASGDFSARTITGTVSVNAPIFYDSNNTVYYGDFADISSMYGVAIRGDLGSTDSRNQIFFWGSGDATTSAIGFKANGGEFPNPTGSGDGYNTYFTMDTDGRGWVFRRGVGGSDFNSANNSGWILNNGVWQANASMRAPIFYDSNNTGYYVDPASTSVLNAVNFVGTFTWTGSGGSRALQLATSDGYASMRVIQNRSTGGNQDGMYIGYENVNGGLTRIFGGGDTGNAMTKYATYTEEANSFRAPIFYDSNDTTYYLNPNGYSQINGNGSVNGSAGIGLNIYSVSNNGAIMAFHRGGYFAVNMGLDSDNVFRIGGWSASANRLQMDMSGNLTMAGNVTAYSDERLKKDWALLPDDFLRRLAQVKSGTYTRIDSEERQVGVSAQGLQEFLKEAVQTDASGMLSVNYGSAALVSSVELAKYVIKLEQRISQLELRNE